MLVYILCEHNFFKFVQNVLVTKFMKQTFSSYQNIFPLFPFDAQSKLFK
jgi:hypothetical protein